MPEFKMTSQYIDGVFLIRTNGYLENDAGEELTTAVNSGFRLGAQKFLLNFQDSPVINSQGVSAILSLSEQIVDVRRGRMAFVGLSKTAMLVFQNTGLLQFAEVADTEGVALAKLA